MKILLTGASGLLGRAFVRSFKDHCSLYACAYSRSSDTLHKLDLLKEADVTQTIESVQPHFIIHCAAERSPDICENDHFATDALNQTATKHLAQCAKAIGATIIYISTDYVFDGTKPPYECLDKPNPLNYYGASKLAGEKAVLDSGAQAIVLRVPVLYGQIESLEESAITVIAKLFENQDSCQVDDWAIRYPAYVDDISHAIKLLIDKIRTDKIQPPQIIHFSGPDALTKYEMAKIMAEKCQLDDQYLTANQAAPAGAPRPHNCQLNDEALMKLIELKKTSLKDVIASLIQPHLAV